VPWFGSVWFGRIDRMGEARSQQCGPIARGEVSW